MTDKPWLPPLVKFTGLLAGRHLYFDENGGEPQMVQIDYPKEDGYAYVTFLDAEPEDAEVTLMARDMSGTFRKV